MKNLILVTTLLLSPIVNAGVAIIVHPSNANELDKSTITRIYTGKAKSFPNGDQAVPITQGDGGTPDAFNKSVLNKSTSQLRAYWSKLIFTGKGAPPKVVESEAEILQLVSTNPNIIGDVDEGSVNDSVKVVATFK